LSFYFKIGFNIVKPFHSITHQCIANILNKYIIYSLKKKCKYVNEICINNMSKREYCINNVLKLNLIKKQCNKLKIELILVSFTLGKMIKKLIMKHYRRNNKMH